MLAWWPQGPPPRTTRRHALPPDATSFLTAQGGNSDKPVDEIYTVRDGHTLQLCTVGYGLQVQADWSPSSPGAGSFDLLDYPAGQRLGTGTYQLTGTQGEDGLFLSASIGSIDTLGPGTVTIDDIDYDASGQIDRLHLTYLMGDFYQGVGNITGVSGEISINEPQQLPDLEVTATQLRWLQRFVGSPGYVQEVQVNDDGLPLASVPAELSGEDAADFSIESNSCDQPLITGGSCRITVGFTPAGAGDRTATLTLGSGDDQTQLPLSGSGFVGTVQLSLRRHAPPHRNHGLDVVYTRNDHIFELSGTNLSVTTSSDPSVPENFSMSVATGYQQELADGTYTAPYGAGYPYFFEVGPDDFEAPAPDKPDCQQLQTVFTIHSVGYDEYGYLDQLSLTFAQTCEGDAAGLRGSLALWLPGPAEAVPPAPAYGAGYVTKLQATGQLHRTKLSWTDPVSPGWDHTVVSEAAGDTPPASPDAGKIVYSGVGHSVDVPVIGHGDVAVSVFSVTSNGAVGPGAGARVAATVMTLTAPENVTGRWFYLSCRLLTRRTGKPLAWQYPLLYRRPHPHARWRPAATCFTNGRGKGHLELPSRTEQLYVKFGGGPGLLGSRTRPLWVNAD